MKKLQNLLAICLHSSLSIKPRIMYSPKIKEEFIPVLYKIARARRLPMTHIVREALDEYLNKPEIVSIKAPKEDNNKKESDRRKPS